MIEVLIRLGLIIAGSVAFGIWQASIAAGVVAAIVLWIWIAALNTR